MFSHVCISLYIIQFYRHGSILENYTCPQLYIIKEKGILIFGKNILRESKNVLVELLTKGEIDRIDKIK